MRRNLDAEMAEQALHVAARLIEAMRAAVPSGNRGATGYAQTLTVAREHDKMCTMNALLPCCLDALGRSDG